MTHETEITDPSSRRMMSGTATLITVASASVRTMPGASARTTSQAGKGRPSPAEGLSWGPEAGLSCGPETVILQVYPQRRRDRGKNVHLPGACAH